MVKLFVGNIREGADAGDLKLLFQKYGAVDECDIITNFGFVHMASNEDAEAAVKGVDGTYFSGSNIKVEMSHNKPPRRGGGGGRGGGRGGGYGGHRGGGGGFRGSRGGGFRGDRDRFGGRDRDRGFERERNGYGRDRGYDRGSRYDDFAPPRVVDDRDFYARDTFRDSYRAGDSYGSRDYERDSYSRDLDRRPSRDYYASSYRDSFRDDPYERRPRDPYQRGDQYIRERRDPYPREPRHDPYSAASYRDRSPLDRKRGYGAPRYR